MIPGWSRVAIAGKPADLLDPPSSLPFVLLFLHHRAGNTPATDSTFTSELVKHRLRCVAPHAPESWWVDRICSEFDPHLSSEQHIRVNVASWIETNWKIGSKAIGLAGHEMGGQVAVRLGFKFPEQFSVIGSIGGAFDFQEVYGHGTPLDEMYTSREQCRQDTAILHIPPHDTPHIWFACSPDDRWHRGNDRLHEKLAALGIAHTALLDEVADNDQFISPMLSFVLTALERESRRLS
jgi:pimeloyl-ACP methyl ester carboxylesterase